MKQNHQADLKKLQFLHHGVGKHDLGITRRVFRIGCAGHMCTHTRNLTLMYIAVSVFHRNRNTV